MPQRKPFEFLVDLRDVGTGKEVADNARLAESIGYHEIVIPDHLIPQLGPITAMSLRADVQASTGNRARSRLITR